MPNKDALIIRLSGQVKEEVKNLQAAIDPNDLDGHGIEDDIHVTVRWGFDGVTREQLQAVIGDQPPARALLTKVSTFPPSPSSDQAEVLKIDVESNDLHRINRIVSNAFPAETSFPIYVPHVTIAYVKPGTAKKYTGRSLQIPVRLDHVTMSRSDLSSYDVPLSGSRFGLDIMSGKSVRETFESSRRTT